MQPIAASHFDRGIDMRTRSAVSVFIVSFCLLPAGLSFAKQPAITVAPGTPLCDASTDPIVCTWTTDGLPDDVAKYAVEVIASYDPNCDGTVDLSQTFSFTTADATPEIDAAYAALDTTVCTSNDNPCTLPATYHARYVQARVKALDPPSKHSKGSQNNAFSGLSDQVEVPGVCGVPCPTLCAAGMSAFLQHLLQTPPSSPSLTCSYDDVRQAGSLDYYDFDQNIASIARGACQAGGYSTIYANTDLSPAEQAACAIQFHDQFQALDPSTTCNISP
jgi:hypothetical protein